MLGSSLTLGDHLITHPETWKLLASPVDSDDYTIALPSAAGLREMFTDCVAATTDGAYIDRLRSLYRDRMLVLASIDLAPTVEQLPALPFVAVGEHLADLADAALAAALRVAELQVCGPDAGAEVPRIAVIAMGKCGARELNYVSDVDVIFVAEEADAVSTRVAGELMRVAGEAFFEVDAGLRPEGRHGALVRTLESHIAYYQRWAKTWEFQALLKARAAVGDAGWARPTSTHCCRWCGPHASVRISSPTCRRCVAGWRSWYPPRSGPERSSWAPGTARRGVRRAIAAAGARPQ